MELTKEQEQAINARGMSVAVSAAAGSGKTRVLISRIIKRVCEEKGDISRILAVTYTKAAAAEIVARLMKAIGDKLAEDPSNRHVARQALMANSARVSTVHRFCLDVIRNNFERLSLPSDLAVGDETKLGILSRKVMEKLVDDYFEGDVSPSETIEEFPTFFDSFASKGSSQIFVSNMLDFYEQLSKKKDYIDSIDESIQLYKNVNAANFLDSAWGIELLKYSRELFEHYARELKDAVELSRVNQDYRKALPSFEYDLALAKDMLTLLEAPDYFALKARLAQYDPPRIDFEKGIQKTEEMLFFQDERTKYMKDARALRSNFFSFEEKDLNETFAATEELLEKIKTFLKAFHKRFSAEKLRRGVIGFSDMEHYALSVLWDRENDAPSDVALRIRKEFDEIYVDEYQDTNEVQDKIFSLVGREDNVFCVGDIKQSIYGYRGAEPSIFDKKLDDREKYYDGFKGTKTKIFLSRNFRSSNEIIDFCNCVFDKIMNVEKEKYGENEKLHYGREKLFDDVEISVLPRRKAGDKSPAPEAQYVARRIAALIRSGVKQKDIAILLRNSKYAGEYESAMKNLGISVKNVVDENFFESGEVLLMLSLLNVIDNPSRDVYLAATLKSGLFGVTLDELLYIRRGSDGSLYDALCAFTEKTGFQKGKRFLAFLEKYRALVPSLPCDKLIWQLYIETDILSLAGAGSELDNLGAEQAKANLIQLYNYARQLGASSYHGLYDFILLINDVIERKKTVKLAPFKTAGDAVSIMTIHGSKGLEFPVVFLSETSSQFNNDETKDSIYVGRLCVSTRMAHSSGFGKLKSPAYMISQISERAGKIDEEIRVLYVALTRAKNKLIITGSSSKPKSFSDIGEYAYRSKYFTGYALRRTNCFLDYIGIACAGRGGYVVANSIEDLPEGNAAAEESERDEMTLVEARRLVNERLDYEYPHAVLTEVPAKVAVSELYPDLLDDGESGEIKEAQLGYVPRFLASEDEDVTAAERGTATHTFMQFFDFDRVEKNGVRAEIDYLAEHKYIFDTDVKKIDVRGIEAFLRSDVAKKMRTSRDVWREKRFILSLNADEFSEKEETKAALRGEKLLVQGVIDCAYRDEDGKIVVVDYKTDHFKRGTPREEIESVLRERHTRQLTYYKKACEMLFGKVSRVLIYSFALNDTVEINGGQI